MEEGVQNKWSDSTVVAEPWKKVSKTSGAIPQWWQSNGSRCPKQVEILLEQGSLSQSQPQVFVRAPTSSGYTRWAVVYSLHPAILLLGLVQMAFCSLVARYE
jgi:hypothetical protein